MKKTMYVLGIFIGLTIQYEARAQGVAVNSDNSTPDPSAMLDVKSSTKGILVPRMTQVQRIAIVSPANGLMIYQTDSTPGFYYNSGTSASPVWVITGTGSFWGLTGNSGTSAGTNFIGTIDDQPLRFRVNNAWAGEIHPTSENVFIGLGSGQVNTLGQANTATGEHSLFANTEGNFNSAYGNYSLSSNTSGYSNTAYGSYALSSNTVGFSNTAIGRNALFANTAGYYNTAAGEGALLANTTGSNNAATGYQALYSNTAGYENTANGYQTLFLNTNGNYNTANGFQALYSNTTANGNTAGGHLALYSNSAGDYNTADGQDALYSNTTGKRNTATGSFALISNTTGDNNTAIGGHALDLNTTGSYNIAIGSYSGTAPGFTNLFNTIGIGNDGSYQHGGSNQVVIGNASMLVIAGKVGWSVLSDARIKNTIEEDVKGLDFILKLRPVTYHISNAAITAVTGSKETPDFPGKYDGEKVKYSGFIAQEVEQAAIAANYEFSGYDVPKNERGLYTIKYAEFVVPLVKAVQELNQKNETLENLVKTQQQVMDILNKQNEQLVQRIEKLETK